MFYPYQPNECKPCIRARVIANRAEKVEYYRAFDRARGRDPKRKAQFIAKQRRMRAANPLMQRAQGRLRAAVIKGFIAKGQCCESCGKIPVEAHHDDHSKPYEVTWLCPVCHAARHKELGRLGKSRTTPAYGQAAELVGNGASTYHGNTL